MKPDPHPKKLTQQKPELDIEASDRQLQEMRDYIALAEEDKRKKLELKQSKRAARRQAKIATREYRIDDRQQNLEEIRSTFDAIFGRSEDGRSFIARLGAFSFRYTIIYGFTVFYVCFSLGCSSVVTHGKIPSTQPPTHSLIYQPFLLVSELGAAIQSSHTITRDTGVSVLCYSLFSPLAVSL